jgi:Protein of unknown function (DUF3455)
MKKSILMLVAGLLVIPCLDTAWSVETEGITLPQGSRLLFAATAEGVQIYESKAAPAGGFQWALKAPEATLKTLAGETFAKHGAGPSWIANDGSKIVGKLPPLTSIKPKDGKNIPWLLVATESQGSVGILSSVKYVVRIDTAGGTAPAEPPTAADQTAKVAYHATYLFLAGGS